MNNHKTNSLAMQPVIITLTGIKSYLFQILFIALAVLMPAAAHLFGAPVSYLLPMHWAVILAGLVYGWRGGAISGFLSPIVSFMITGMPSSVILFPMTAELFTYGFVTGYLRENFKLKAFISVAFALIAGRIIYFLIAMSTGLITSGPVVFLQLIFFPGMIAAAAQIIILPLIAKWWVNKENNA